MNRTKKDLLDRTNGQHGRCGTTLVGQGFTIEASAGRTVNVQGSQKDMQINQLPLVTAVTAVGLPEETIILEFNETVYVEGNKNSLISTFEVRENGAVINDTSKRHGGR